MTFAPRLLQCSADTLAQLSILCGLPVQSTKAARTQSLLDGLKIGAKLPTNMRVLAVDMGIKNFSYCQTVAKSKPTIEKWTKVDLNNEYGATFKALTSDPGSLIDSRRYLRHLAYNIVSTIIKDKPHLIMVETQRTRSNNMNSTLPNVLLNYTLENMIYAVLYTLKTDAVIIPMNANNMISFWLNRFVDKKSLSSNPKKLRIKLAFEWLAREDLRPFIFHNSLPPDFSSLSTPNKSRALLNALQMSPKEKVDDLIDSLLYALTANEIVTNQKKLARALEQDQDIAALVHNLNQNHLRLISRLAADGDVTLAKIYANM